MTQEEDNDGFTLVELLVVVIIIGILAAIAIPTFLNQRERAWERTAQSDLRNAVIQIEDLAVASSGYGLVDASSFKTSDDVSIRVVSSSSSAYCMTVDHERLTGNPDFHFDSNVGRQVPGSC